MKYYSEKLDKLFETEDALFKAEKAADEVQKQELDKQAKLLTEKQEAMEEVRRLGTKVITIKQALRTAEKEYTIAANKLRDLNPYQIRKGYHLFPDNYDSVFDYVSDVLGIEL